MLVDVWNHEGITRLYVHMKKQNSSFRFRVRGRDFKKSIDSKYQCVSVSVTSQGVAVRDTKDKKKNPTTLFFTLGEWKAFLSGVDKGQFAV